MPVFLLYLRLEQHPKLISEHPPRRGMDRFALDALAKARVPTIVYVSCDPSTLARDIQRLQKTGYALQESVVVDMFPQTYHIESVNLLTLA